MTVCMRKLTHIFFATAISIFAAQVSAAMVNFAGNTGSAAAAVAMNGQTTHVGDSGQALPILVSTQTKYPPVDHKPQVFQRLWSEIRVPGARDPKRNQAILTNNDQVFPNLAGMYKKTQDYAATQQRPKLMIDVLTVEASDTRGRVGSGFARSRKFAEYIFKSLKDKGVENISLDPAPRDPIPLPPGLTGEQPKGRT